MENVVMSVRNAIAAGIFAATVAAPAVAFAAAAYTTGTVNMRSGPSTSYNRILTIPAGARINVNGCSSWCSVSYRGYSGYVSASYVSRAYAGPPRQFRRPPPPTYGWSSRPWWDDRHGAWYDGRRWYSGGRWHDRPSGLSFGFSFGG
jgi:uncharacterized protein YraI